MNLRLTAEEPVESLRSNVKVTNSMLQDNTVFTGGPNFIILTKENIQEGVCYDGLLKFLFHLEPSNFRGTPTIVKKFAELIHKEKDGEA